MPMDGDGHPYVLDNATMVANTPQTVVPAVAGKNFRVLGGELSASTATVVKLQDHTGPTVLFSFQTAAGVPHNLTLPAEGVKLTNVNSALEVITPGTPAVSVNVWGEYE